MLKFEDILKCKILAFKTFGMGGYLGDEEIMISSKRRFYIKSVTETEIMMLSKIDF